MAVTAQQVKELNTVTGAGILDCKKALIEKDGDFEAAIKLLQEKGMAALGKRADRVTAEGKIFVRQVGNKIAVAQIECETDFVANNAEFGESGEKILDAIFAKGYTKVEQELSDILSAFATKVRENMSVKKVQVFEVAANTSAGIYVHSDKKSAAVVLVEGSEADTVKEFAKDCCMHLVAFTPAYINKSEVPADYVNEQTEIFKAQMAQDEKMAAKPENVRAGILQGKINKHLAEICFVDQMFVKDDKKTVQAKLDEVGKAAGASLKFGEISLFVIGK